MARVQLQSSRGRLLSLEKCFFWTGNQEYYIFGSNGRYLLIPTVFNGGFTRILAKRTKDDTKPTWRVYN